MLQVLAAKGSAHWDMLFTAEDRQVMEKTIIEILAEQKVFLKEKYHINQIGIFGSYARGEETVKSDVDILVEFEEVPGFFDFFSIEEYLEKKLHKKIDLVRKEGLKKQLREQILSEVIYI